MTSSSPLVVLGPTASGKSDVAMAVASAAEFGPVEIVAVDAMQVYRGMDIGTAKPTAADRAVVAHHGLDLVDPDHEFALAEFAPVALDAIADIETRGRRPVVVGGTGLYLRALTDPMEMPGTWPELRAALDGRAEAAGAPALHAELVLIDPDAAAKMEPSNVRRIVRALEVWQGSGRRFSSFGPGVDQYPPVRFEQIGLRWPRPVLAQRIEQRVHRMMQLGLLSEVTGLVERYPAWSRTAR